MDSNPLKPEIATVIWTRLLLALALTAGLLALPGKSLAALSINSITLNGVSSVTVSSGATISAIVNATTTGIGINAQWKSTGWRIANTPGLMACLDHTNFTSAGTYQVTLSVTAPAPAGTYNAYFIGYTGPACGGTASPTYTLANGVVVTAGATPPTVTTAAATVVTTTGATLNGTVSSNGASTTVTFEYGLTVGYGTTVTATQSPLAAGASGSGVSAAVSGLTCGTLYHFRVRGVNSAGTSNGADLTFTTAACAVSPTVTTNGATVVTATGATLNGTVSSNGASTTVTFGYGLTSGSYGFTVTAAQSPLAAGATGSAVSAGVTGLSCGTVYYFRASGVNSAGTTNGGELTFTTSACPVATFDAVEVGQAAATRIATKLAGTAFSLDVLASGSGGALTLSVALVDPNAASGNCSDTNGGLTPETVYVTSFGTNRLVTVNFNSANGAKNVRVRIIDTSTNVPYCSWDNFAVRPLSFTVTSSATADPTGLSPSATPAIKAGAGFTMTAASGVAGYDGIPKLDATKAAGHGGAVLTGTVAGSFGPGSLATGIASGASFTYTEVGYFKLAGNGVYDDTFTNVDIITGDCSNDFSNTLVGGKYGCKFGNTAATSYFGRFTPDHFAIIPGVVTPGCGTFTYFSQDGFATAFTLIAQNQANGTTQNYGGSFARLDQTVWSNFTFTAPGLPGGATLAGSSTPPTGNWSNGTVAVGARHQISRPATPVASADVTIYAGPTDPDGVTMAPVAVQAATTPLRYGRIVLQNVYGPETEALKMQLLTQYHDGTSFIPNPTDTCSSYDATALIPGCTDPDLTDSLGCGDVSSADVNVGHGQYFTFTPPLKTGTLLYTMTTDPWLQYEWDELDNDYNENPAAQATFGLYRGNDRIINWGEVMR